MNNCSLYFGTMWLLSLGASLSSLDARAQQSNTIFPEGWDRSVRDRMFMRLGPIYVNTKTNSSEAVDLTGPVMSIAQLERTRTWVTTASNAAIKAESGSILNRSDWLTALNTILGTSSSPTMIPEILSGKGLGTPPGVKAKVGDTSTVALSMGYWLTEERDWALEAFVMGKPLDIKVYGDGVSPASSFDADGDRVPGPNGVAGKHIISMKMLPITMVLSRHFGEAGNTIRPYFGVGALYAFCYDARTTSIFDTYVGGKSSVHVKNAFGMGPFLGLTGKINDAFALNFQIGLMNIKSEAIITTRNTLITSQSSVLWDFSEVLVSGADLVASRDPDGFLTGLSNLVAAHGEDQRRADLGTFSRKQSQKIRATMFNVSLELKF